MLPYVCEIVPYMPPQKARSDTREEWGEARQRWGLCSCKPEVAHLEEPLEAVLLGSLPFQALSLQSEEVALFEVLWFMVISHRNCSKY